jgi:hypothetical protein
MNKENLMTFETAFENTFCLIDLDAIHCFTATKQEFFTGDEKQDMYEISITFNGKSIDAFVTPAVYNEIRHKLKGRFDS